LSSGWGFGVTSRVSLQSEYFGRQSFGTVFGLISAMMMIGTVAGAPIAGWVFDRWGTYQWVWMGYSLITLVGAVLILTIPPSPLVSPVVELPALLRNTSAPTVTRPE
jgi:MFS family permease